MVGRVSGIATITLCGPAGSFSNIRESTASGGDSAINFRPPTCQRAIIRPGRRPRRQSAAPTGTVLQIAYQCLLVSDFAGCMPELKATRVVCSRAPGPKPALARAELAAVRPRQQLQVGRGQRAVRNLPNGRIERPPRCMQPIALGEGIGLPLIERRNLRRREGLTHAGSEALQITGASAL